MKREELLKSKEYWITKIQLDLFELINKYMKENNLNKTQLATKLGVSKGYITQILNGNFDHKISKLIELSLAFDRVPVLEYEKINDYLFDDYHGLLDKQRKQIQVVIDYSDLHLFKEGDFKSFSKNNFLDKTSVKDISADINFKFNTPLKINNCIN
ncbi:helix-turn-helix transcriptional regulator [Flavobacterium sp.]|uniref:helix-turn-helix domain-containing protein n=1 Tax=Flavobacterium sp. TaxID=239 RepID=UPI003342143A